MDYIQQLGENEHSPHPSVVRLPGMHDLGFLKLHTVEDHIGEISRGYRSRDHFHREVILPDHLLTDSVDQILPSSNFSQLKWSPTSQQVYYTGEIASSFLFIIILL